MDLLTRPATEILAALGRRDVSAVELLDATLARIDALNPRINAVVARDAEAARRAAQASDARRAKGLDGLLEGLPMTIKDAYDVAGLVSTAGAPSWRERVPDVDAVPVARLRAAGAVILGKTNVPPWSADWIAENPHYGRTCNPWNLAHSPGGSSGGAVAALATGMTALELGSDLVASIRWPAHATGVFGLKPTWGLVSMRGHRPPSPGVDIEGDLAVAGPLARSARDLDLMLSVIAGPPALDGPRPVIAPPRRSTPQGLRVAVWASDPFAPVDHAVVAGVRRAASLLAGAGADVDADARPAFSFAEAFEVYALIAHAIVAVELPEKVRDRLAAEASSYAPDDISHRALQTRAARMDAALYRSLKDRRAAIRRAWGDFFERFDVVLMPPAPVTAVPHPGEADPRVRRLVVDGAERPWMDMFHWSGPASVANLPAAVAPVMLTDAGLPTGVQIVAAEGADRTATAVAGMLEALGCAYRRPPMADGA
jgi:amidase